jgi:hypothetical protein
MQVYSITAQPSTWRFRCAGAWNFIWRRSEGEQDLIPSGPGLFNLSQVPGNLKNTPKNQLALEELFRDPNIKRIAGHASSLFKTYFPRMHAYYQETLEALLKAHPHLRPAFPNDDAPRPGGGHIPWCAASPNVGEWGVTFHTQTRPTLQLASVLLQC